MSLWRITDDGPKKLPETAFRQEKILEEKLEDWILSDPSILGESLFVVGRQVLIPDTKDRIDILALDTAGNGVIIELKRGHLKDPVDIQALRYASYISKWDVDDFENHARNFVASSGAAFDLRTAFAAFCEEAGVDEAPEINRDQRLVVVGSAVREKLGSVALWLRDHSVDITVIEVRAFKEHGELIIQPNVIVPLPISRFADTGRTPPVGAPWVADGRAWHLDKRCGPRSRQVLLALEALLLERFELTPRWNQKNYVSFRVNNYNWLAIGTQPNMLYLNFLLRAGAFAAADVATKLGVALFDKESSLSDKFGLSSSVFVRKRNPKTDRLILRVKDDFDPESPAFLAFLNEALKAAPE